MTISRQNDEDDKISDDGTAGLVQLAQTTSEPFATTHRLLPLFFAAMLQRTRKTRR